MRILAVTSLYPNPYQPHRASFNRQQLRALADQHELAIIAPIAWTDELALRRAGGRLLPAGRRVVCDGLAIDHPRYLFPPKVLRHWYGHCFKASIRKAFRKRLEEFRPDVIYAAWAYPDGWAAVELAKEAGLPVAVKAHGSDVLLLDAAAGRRRRTIEALGRADAVIAVSRHLAGKIAELDVNEKRIHVVYNGIDRGLFCGERREGASLPAGMESGGLPRVLFVGNLVAVKAPDVLIEACGRLALRGVQFDCRLIGQGPMKEALARRIGALGLQDRVKLVGSRPLEELPDWYRAASVLVLPSHSEGIPNVVLEAIACGTPVVASRVGGVPEILEESALVPPGDADLFAAAIERTLGRERVATSGRFEPPTWAESARGLAQVLAGMN